MKLGFTFAIVLLLPLVTVAAEKPASDAAVLGSWEGKSICTVKDSPCHDEHVVYEISRDPSAPSRFKIDAYKIVNGEKDFMGPLSCAFDAKASVLHCSNPGEWVFQLAGTHIEGTLHLADANKTLYRRIWLDKK